MKIPQYTVFSVYCSALCGTLKLLTFTNAACICRNPGEVLILFASSTAFELMFGRPPQRPPFPPDTTYDPTSYSHQLHSKLSQLYDLVEIQRHPTINSSYITNMLNQDPSKLVTMFGWTLLQQGNLTQSGREDGWYKQ